MSRNNPAVLLGALRAATIGGVMERLALEAQCHPDVINKFCDSVEYLVLKDAGRTS